MPANFTEEQRQKIRDKLIAIGYDLIREMGLKKMKVSIIAERAEIATGTLFLFIYSVNIFIYYSLKWIITQKTRLYKYTVALLFKKFFQ